MNENTSTNFTVMVVDDFDETRFMLKRWLESRNCRVVEAADGWQAVEMAIRERPELILMDLNLPETDGFTGTSLIRERAELRDVPIIAITAYGADDYRAEAIDVGCDEYVTKPLDLDILGTIFDRYLLKKSAANGSSG